MVRLERAIATKALSTLAVLGIAGLALLAIPATDSPTYRSASRAAETLGVAAGAALVVAALVTVRIAIALPLLGLAAVWFAQDLGALGDAAAVPPSIAAGAAPFAAALALHLALALPDGRVARGARGGVIASYLVAGTCAVGTVATRDPFRDVYCWRQCGSNPLLVHAAPGLARGFVVASLVVSAVVGVAAVTVVARRMAAATRVGRALLAPALVPVGLVAVAEAARAVALLGSPLEDPRRSGFQAVYLLRASALIALGAGVTWTIVRARRTRAAVTALAGQMGSAPPPAALTAWLAVALGDPAVDVLYWVPVLGRFVDADGALRAPPASASTRIKRGGRLLAVVVHDAAVLPGRDLDRLLGPAARLAIENAALHAEVLAQLRRLRRSRARIVATADESRRRMERDLHDGTQQRLLAVALDLRLARAGAQGELAEQLGRIDAEIDRAFTELRELAHGIYPAVLTEAGLEAALPTLADIAPIAVELRDVTDERLAPTVEAGGYVTVHEAIRDATRRRATAMAVSAVVRDGCLVITAADDGAPRDSALVHVADRLGALGGRLELGSATLHAEIPCV